jgi:hypothetical protein
MPDLDYDIGVLGAGVAGFIVAASRRRRSEWSTSMTGT